MGLVHRGLPYWGVQFHPESVLTGSGSALIANFLALCGEHSAAGARATSQATLDARIKPHPATAGPKARGNAVALSVQPTADAVAPVKPAPARRSRP